MSKPIESYAMIGDCETAALVGDDGSIDWLCWPRFSSDSTFAALLGDADNGRWLIAPKEGGLAARRFYHDDTLILETVFETAGGEVSVIDFMPLRERNSDLVRLVRGRRGRVRMHMDLAIRFGYGRIIPWVRRVSEETGEALVAIGGPDMVVLHTDVPHHGEGPHTVADFEIGAGEEVSFILTYGPSHRPPPRAIDVHAALEDTERFWSDWSSGCTSRDRLRDRLGEKTARIVMRSLITLKALTYAPTGGIVAAPTSSLPEEIGGERNWDYRYCWLRDATMTLITLMDAGYYDEARAWRDWLLRAIAGSPDQIQIMYGLAGERRLIEWHVPWLAGYEGSRPVRIGNAAHIQVQHDVFGEVVDALYQARRGGLTANDAAWALESALIAQLERDWREPDAGIWEVRSGPRHFTYSKIMSWVAVDRAIRSAEEFGLGGPLERWRELRRTIHDDVCANGYDAELGCFVQSYGGKALDASLLQIPVLGFLPASDPRYRRTVEAIEKRLAVDGFILRYRPEEADDGLQGGEGAFLACSFWLADALAMLGRAEEAQELFLRLVDLRNDVDLLAEEYDPRHRRQLGNFPQAFTHVALVDTAMRLARLTGEEERRPAEAEA